MGLQRESQPMICTLRLKICIPSLLITVTVECSPLIRYKIAESILYNVAICLKVPAIHSLCLLGCMLIIICQRPLPTIEKYEILRRT